MLDVGCGVGAFLRLVADRGGEPFGLDASEALIDVRAHGDSPDADLRVGEMEALPYDDDTFDLVTGFNSFFFANDMVAALREAGRVAKPGAPVVIQVWGAHERCDLEAMKQIARPFLPPRPPDAPPDPDLSAARACSQALADASRPEPESRVRHDAGPTSIPTRRRSAARSSPSPASPSSPAPTANRSSRPRSSTASRPYRRRRRQLPALATSTTT